MSGWRDIDGRTSAERRRAADAAERKSLVERLRRKPWILVRPALILLLALALAYALLF